MPELGVFGEPPEPVLADVGKIQEIKRTSAEERRAMKDRKQAETDSETYLIVCFDSREEKERMLSRLGLAVDERYVDGEILARVVESARGAE